MNDDFNNLTTTDTTTDTDIPNGATYTGTLLFQIPRNSTINQLVYSGGANETSYSIIWTPTGASTILTPTPTPNFTPTLKPTLPESTPTNSSTTETTSPVNSGELAVTLASVAIVISIASVIALLLYVRSLKKRINKQYSVH